MKNLATCKPSEFLKQTNRIKRSAEKWLTETDILSIRKRMPELVKIDYTTMSESDIEKVKEENKKRVADQAMKNLSVILDEIMEMHPDETLELLALLCFVEPEDVDSHPMCEYLDAIREMIMNEAVLGFFTSLRRLGLTGTPNA